MDSLKDTRQEAAATHAPKAVDVHDRLIFALDVPDPETALDLVEKIGDAVSFYKIGLELLLGGDYRAVIDRLRGAGKKVMLDLKMFDVPETVARAVRQLPNLGVTFATVHGNDGMLEAAVAEKADVKILAVTVLTSLDRADLDGLGFDVEPQDLVLSRARRALELGCDGVVSSGLEAPSLRSALGDAFLVVTPGIRPVENRSDDDQKRVVSVEDAFRNGADHIVVGRPIRDARDPRAEAERIQRSIAALFAA